MAYKLKNRNAATLMAKSPLYNTPPTPKQMVSLRAEELKAPDRAEYDEQHAYDQAVVEYDRKRNYNPDKVEYNPKDPSTYSEAKLTRAHVRPNVRGAVGQMSPLKGGPGGFDAQGRRIFTDSQGRPISRIEDDPNYDASGERTLATVTGDESQNKKVEKPEKSTKTKTKTKANTTSGYTGVGRPTQSGNTKPPDSKKEDKKPDANTNKKAKKTNTTSSTTNSTATQTKIDKTIASQPEKGLGASDMISAIKENVGKTQATVDRATNANYDLISSQQKSGGRVSRVRRRQQKRTANLERRLQNRAEIQGIRQSERGKRQGMRESASQERKNLMTDMPVDKDATGGRQSSQPSTVKSSTKVENKEKSTSTKVKNKEKSTSQPKLKGKAKRQKRRSDRFAASLGGGKPKSSNKPSDEDVMKSLRSVSDVKGL